MPLNIEAGFIKHKVKKSILLPIGAGYAEGIEVKKMKALAHKERLVLSGTLSILLDELDGECQRTIKLIENLQSYGLTDNQLQEMFGELSATVTHLRIHSEQVEKAIEEELEKEA